MDPVDCFPRLSPGSQRPAREAETPLLIADPSTRLAIAGVLGAYLVMYPHAKVVTFIPFGFVLLLRELPALVVLGLWFVLQLFTGVVYGGPGIVSRINRGLLERVEAGGYRSISEVVYTQPSKARSSPFSSRSRFFSPK